MAQRKTRIEMKAETRERLLQAAEAIAAEHGLARITLEAVAEAAGVTKGAIYSNFASKQDLLLEVVSRMTPGVNLTSAVTGSPDIATLLRRAATALATAADTRSQEALLLLELDTVALRDPKLRRALVQAEADQDTEDPTGMGAWFEQHADELPLPVDQFLDVVNALAWGLLIRRMVYGPERVPDELMTWAFSRFTVRPDD